MNAIAGKIGTIRGGKYDAFKIRVHDDETNTGGYLIFVWKEGASEGFDDWAEHDVALAIFS